MANKKFLAGILVMGLVFGMTVIACSSDSGGGEADPALNGTWVTSSDGFTFTNGEFLYRNGGYQCWKGSYTTSGSSITLSITGIFGGHPDFKRAGLTAIWYSRNDFKKSYPNTTDKELNDIFQTISGTYTINGTGKGSKLNINWKSGLKGTDTFTKQ